MAGKTAVLCIGWHVKTVAAFERLGCRVVSAVTAKDLGRASAHSAAADLVLVTDANNLEAVLAGLTRAGVDPAGFDAVCSIHELSLVTAAALARLTGRQVLPVETAIALRDKFVQKRLIRAAGLPVADCRVVGRLGDLAEGAWTGPLVVKPLADAGSRDTFALRTPQELAALLAADRPGAGSGPWLVEGFVEGAELHLDGVVRGGELLFLSVSRYLDNVISVRSGGVIGSVALDPADRPELYGRARELVVRALDALGHRDGVFHLEAFDGRAGLVFSECAGRIGGGMIPDVNAHAFGVDLVEEFARAVLQLPSGLPAGTPTAPATRRPACGFVQLAAPAGRIDRMPTEQQVLDRPGCTAVRLALTEGAEVPDFTAGSHLMAGKALLTADDDTALEQRMHELADWFRDAVITSPAVTSPLGG
ncbi:ATP-grasp domain-containing protein [Kitasatospora sp. LaBMicrA B282]|uniref:ATP-grasp domain-containing protein n=1 Tax=Kitasatospora sp. LaBMicrA B282 TaxID=3420949 RepID=UPI003D0E0FE3